MAITNMDQLINAISGRPIIPIQKASATAKAAGSFQSLWTVAGFPAAGAAAGSVNGAICTKATTGALQFADAGGGETLYLGQLGIQGATIGTVFVYDRLWHSSAFNGTLTTAQTLTMPALTRHTDGTGVECFAEWYTATGSTAVTATLSYTNTADQSGRSGTASFIASPVAGQMIPFQLAAGDAGIKSIQSVTLSATTGTAGNFGLTLMKRKASIPITTANIGSVLDAIALGMPWFEANACVAFMVQCSATNTGYINGTTCIISG
jgi:hypothetical protein